MSLEKDFDYLKKELGFNKIFAPKNFYLSSYNLPYFMTEAALESNNYIWNMTKEAKSIKYLGKILCQITHGKNPVAKLSENCTILKSAISGRKNSQEYWKNKSIDEVVLQTNSIAKNLMNFENLPKNKQKELSDFCLRLAIEILDQGNQYIKREKELLK